MSFAKDFRFLGFAHIICERQILESETSRLTLANRRTKKNRIKDENVFNVKWLNSRNYSKRKKILFYKEENPIATNHITLINREVMTIFFYLSGFTL